MGINGILIPIDGSSIQPNPATSWEEMRASLTLAPGEETANTTILEDYYGDTTGHTNAPDGDPGTLLDVGDALITSTWLAANEDGTHVYQSGGRWVLDGVTAFRIKVEVDNLTVRRSYVDLNNTTASNLNCIAYEPPTGGSYFGLIVEYCTLTGGSTGCLGKGVLSLPSGSGATQTILRYNRVTRLRVGMQNYRHTTMHHNWISDSHYESGSHNEAGLFYGGISVCTRNYLTTGNSAALAIYAALEPINNLLVKENIFRTDIASYAINYASGKTYYGQGGANNHLTDNVFFLTPGDNSSFPPDYNYLAGGEWETKTGNVYIDGTVIPNS